MKRKTSLNEMIHDLENILINSKSFPKERDMPSKEMRNALIKFKNKYKPKHNIDVRVKTVADFVKKYKIFGIVENDFVIFEKLGAIIVIIEGADGTGKTKLSEKIAEMLNGVAIENQASALFHRMFKLSKTYKVAVVDYNTNLFVGFLFYLVVNMIGLQGAVNGVEKGNKHIVLDSSFLRTFASHLAHPSDLRKRESKIKINRELYNLIQNNLNKKYLKLLKNAKHSLLLLFLYASESARLTQVEHRYKSVDTNDYDTNSKYAEVIAKAMIKNEQTVKREGMPAISIETITRAEAKKHKKRTDFVVVRTNNTESDIRAKAKLVNEYIKQKFILHE